MPFDISKTFVVGGLGQGLELLTLGHVFNRIATAQQAQIPHPSFAKTVKTLYSTGGIKEFYKGLRWNLLSSCAKAGTRWTLTSSLYHAVESYVPSDVRDNAFWSDAVAVGFSAAFVETTFVLTPMESFRTLEMTTALQKHKQAVSETSKKQGMIRTLLKGWDRVFVRQLTSWVTYLVAYDKVKTLVLGNPDDNKPRGQASLVQKAAVGVGTGAVACVLTTPLDMLRTQTQMEGASATMQGKSIIGAARHVLQQHGSIAALYGSFAARLMRSGWYSCVTLLCMDYFDALPKRMKM